MNYMKYLMVMKVHQKVPPLKFFLTKKTSLSNVFTVLRDFANEGGGIFCNNSSRLDTPVTVIARHRPGLLCEATR